VWNETCKKVTSSAAPSALYFVGDAVWRRPFSRTAVASGSGSVGEGGSGILTAKLKGRIDEMVQESDVVVFMKGVPSEPRCGFSNAVAQIFRMHDIPIKGHDVLADEEIRQGIKEYSNWPTIPQVFFKGEFMGGCDIMIEMHQNGELIEELKKIGLKSALETTDSDKKD